LALHKGGEMSTFFRRFISDEQGQDLIEYALLGAFVSLAVVAGATALGSGLNNWYTEMGGTVDAFDSQP
jgi:pilus assembly protein Flp/PilA